LRNGISVGLNHVEAFLNVKFEAKELAPLFMPCEVVGGYLDSL
jgi:hypothetical protein